MIDYWYLSVVVALLSVFFRFVTDFSVSYFGYTAMLWWVFVIVAAVVCILKLVNGPQ